MSSHEERLTIQQVCEANQVSRRTFYRMLPELDRLKIAVRVPPSTGRWRVSPSGFEAWLKRGGPEGAALWPGACLKRFT
ncbi:MAG: helix-turn-helix domain-containing protein [Planctomycetota bacterium]|nr:helix-turn-helix domain-containing protein [Planctomycetota bacterium]